MKKPYTVKRKIYALLESGRFVQWFLMVIISLNVLAVVMESEQSLGLRFGAVFNWFALLSLGIFCIEYCLRVWTSVEDPRFSEPIVGRVRFMMSPLALIDLLAIAPFLIGLDLRFLRAARLLRMFSLLKLGRYSAAMQLFARTLRSCREQLALVASLFVLLILVASSAMYCVESRAQPDVYSSIPKTMWWTVVTLTTVGYGDVCPVTAAGKVLAGSIAVMGIAAFALPTAILGSAFMEELARQKVGPALCPHCGKPIDAKGEGDGE